jgi:hypothetical protein
VARRTTAVVVHAIAALALATACVHRIERKVGTTLETVDMRAPYLKVHMRNGDLYVLAKWTIEESTRSVVGTGRKLGPDRVPAPTAVHRVAMADVALYETNTIVTSPGVASMSVLTGLSVVASIACLTNPKACFGSCPTFYAVGDDGRAVLQAEGFSDAIAPSLEKHDIDALSRTTGRPGPITIRVTNEAYETHVIKAADLLAVPRPPGGRVLATDDELYTASGLVAPLACTDSAGADCGEAVRAVDGRERTSLTDGEDLAARETIELAFVPGEGRVAVAIGARQSLVTTFLMYQGLAYLGTTAGAWLAELERGGAAARAGGRALQGLVGGIEVQLERDGVWETAGTVYETGPLATDVHLVRLPAGATGEHVRLRLPRGGWRIEWIALASNTAPATAIRIAPRTITGTLGSEFARGRAAATAFPIVTMPGDAYELVYDLPGAGGEYELFLDSRGYYLEWMRQQWLDEEQPVAAIKLFLFPDQALKDLAPAFKRLEPDAETLFWSSRYARP